MSEFYNKVKIRLPFIKYTLLVYIDKAIVFLLPLLVLFIYNDKLFYVQIEYIYSVATVIIPVFGFGINSYVFYSYKEVRNRVMLMRNFMVTFFGFLLFGVVLSLLLYLLTEEGSNLFYIGVRVLFVFSILNFSSIYRLLDNPSLSVIYSILTNLSCVLILFVADFLKFPISLNIFFLSQLFFVLIVLGFSIKKKYIKGLISSFRFVKRSFLYAWPTILQTFVLMGVFHFGKIYGLNKMSDNEMLNYSLSQRYTMIIQLAHTSLIGYMTKSIFLEKRKKISSFRLIRYLGVILASALLVIVLVFILSNLSQRLSIEFNFVFWGLVLYTIFWCASSYLELNFGRENENIVRLNLSLLSSITFILVFFLLHNKCLSEKIVLAMDISSLVYLFSNIFALKIKGYKFY